VALLPYPPLQNFISARVLQLGSAPLPYTDGNRDYRIEKNGGIRGCMETNPEADSLKRGVLAHASNLRVGDILGVGIYAVIGKLPDFPLCFGFVPTAMLLRYAELGSRFPQSGGVASSSTGRFTLIGSQSLSAG